MIHARRDITAVAEPDRQVIGTMVTDIRRLPPIMLLPIGCFLVGFSFIRHKHIYSLVIICILCVGFVVVVVVVVAIVVVVVFFFGFFLSQRPEQIDTVNVFFFATSLFSLFCLLGNWRDLTFVTGEYFLFIVNECYR